MLPFALLATHRHSLISTFSRTIVPCRVKPKQFVTFTLANGSSRSAPREVTHVSLPAKRFLPALNRLPRNKFYSYILTHPPDPRRVMRRGGSGLYIYNGHGKFKYWKARTQKLLGGLLLRESPHHVTAIRLDTKLEQL